MQTDWRLRAVIIGMGCGVDLATVLGLAPAHAWLIGSSSAAAIILLSRAFSAFCRGRG